MPLLNALLVVLKHNGSTTTLRPLLGFYLNHKKLEKRMKFGYGHQFFEFKLLCFHLQIDFLDKSSFVGP